MEQSKEKFPGFIDGLKASNISVNKTSLMEYSEQILDILTKLPKDKVKSELLMEKLQRGEQTIKNSLNEDISPENLIQLYIKFGDIIKASSNELKNSFNNAYLKEIAINYLKIAKFIKDSRIKTTAISIAKDFE